MHKETSKYTWRGFAKVAAVALGVCVVGAIIWFLGFTQVYEVPQDHRGLVIKDRLFGILGNGYKVVAPGVYPVTGFKRTTQVFLVKLGARTLDFEVRVLSTSGGMLEKANDFARDLPAVGKLSEKIRGNVKPKNIYGTMTVELGESELAALAPRIVKETRINYDSDARARLEAALKKHYKEADAEKLKELSAAVTPDLKKSLAEIPLTLTALNINEVRETSLIAESDNGKLVNKVTSCERAISPLPVTTKFLVRYALYGIGAAAMALAFLAMLITMPNNSKMVGWLDVLGGVGDIMEIASSFDP